MSYYGHSTMGIAPSAQQHVHYSTHYAAPSAAAPISSSHLPSSYYASSASTSISAPAPASTAAMSVPSIHQHASAAKKMAAAGAAAFYSPYAPYPPHPTAAAYSHASSYPHAPHVSAPLPHAMSPPQSQPLPAASVHLSPPSYSLPVSVANHGSSHTHTPSAPPAVHSSPPSQPQHAPYHSSQANVHAGAQLLSLLQQGVQSGPSSLPLASSPPPSVSASAPVPSIQTGAAASTAAPSLASILSELDTRFLLNLPDEELASFERIMFQLQQAHWFYLDMFCERFTSLPRLGFKQFCVSYFKHLPSFKRHLSKFDAVYASFCSYLNSVPVCGCILVNPQLTHVLMVRSWGAEVWGFPRGKLDANEDEITCAIREVDEEVGFDCRAWFKGYELMPPSAPGSDPQLQRQNSAASSASSSAAQQPSYLEVHSAKKSIRLYVLLGVDQASEFRTRTRKEISAIEWVPLSSLPTKQQNDYHGFRFSNATTMFASKLRNFIKKLKAGQITGYGRYESNSPRQAPQPTPQQQPPALQQTPAKKGGKKATQQQQQQQQQQCASQSTPSQPRRSASEQKPARASELDARNHETFDLNPKSSSGGGSGWSPEAMFAANARLGVVSSVAEEKPQLPAHLDAALDAALGRKPQANNGGKSARKGKKVSASPPPSIAHSTSEPTALRLPAAKLSLDDLDFGHNPYVNFANLSLHQQPLAAATANNAAAPQSQEADKADASGKKKGRQQRSKKENTATPAKEAVPQYKILQRPTSTTASADIAPASSSAPAASVLPPATGDAAADFRFELQSIMGPLSANV